MLGAPSRSWARTSRSTKVRVTTEEEPRSLRETHSASCYVTCFLCTADHHEGWDAYKPVTPEDPTKLMRGPNQWPATPATFRPVMEDWVEKMKVLGHALMEATALGLGMDLKGEEWAKLKESVGDSFWCVAEW